MTLPTRQLSSESMVAFARELLAKIEYWERYPELRESFLALMSPRLTIADVEPLR